MDTSLLITLIVAILTVAAGVVGAAISIIYKGHCDKIAKRVCPTISILDDNTDNIDEILIESDIKAGQRINWFIDYNKINEANSKRHFYLCFNVYDRYKIHDYKVEINYDAILTKNSLEYKIGTLSINRRVVIPVLADEIVKGVKCTVKYKTERSERMEYVFISDIDIVKKSLKPKSGTLKLNDKKIFYEEFNECISYSSEQIKSMLGGRKFFKGGDGDLI